MTYLEDAQGSGYLESLGSKPTFDDNFDFEIRYMLPEVFGKIEIVEQGKAQINGASGRWVRFRSGKNEELISIFYMYPKLNQTFKITGTAPSEHFEQIQPYFTSIIESFNSSEL
ncbi:hypothetical protein [Algoriphagus hitonicola]|uniref:Uncharacterized protein n=1 Tax=Algoriphagus hitonicola TaxID=435880 RepID=A0A1I2Q6V2_9BACT|nr:hypothetical protein [Algoriphagus hitonicola]SFG24038.1 hypothetical protein SAMN04487988_102138 [Algoriphagus hitonicola]